MLPEWPQALRLRTWQHEAYAKYVAERKGDFLITSTPGAGKTRCALRIAYELFRIGIVNRAIIVCPSNYIKQQWAKAASEAGLHLEPDWSNSTMALPPDYHGACLTYHQVASNPDAARYLCRGKTLVVFDEIHHAGDNLSWGDALEEAFDRAERRLALSGTPFRTDNNAIPFVEYEDGTSRADFPYTYAQAIGDGVCRPVLFPSFEGKMKWYARGAEFSHSFRDAVNADVAAKRLRTALDAQGEWVRGVLRDANSKLSILRLEHAAAAGLILAMDQLHAYKLSETLNSVTGETATVVTSDDPRAKELIEQFAESTRRWIIAVKMISEGVDIPRLRVGVYATNILTEMYFRQAVGRFVRMVPGIDDQNAYFYIPRDETLVAFAQKIKEEREHQLEESIREAMKAENLDEQSDDKVLSLYVPISSTSQPDDIFFDHERFSQEEVKEAENLRNACNAPSNYDPTILARLIRKVRSAEAKPVEPRPEETAEEPLFIQNKQLRKIIRQLTNAIIEDSDHAVDHKGVYRRQMELDGLSIEQCSIKQLKTRIECLENWRRELAK